MKVKRWKVERAKEDDFNNNLVFYVTDLNPPTAMLYKASLGVWWDPKNKEARCCGCSSPLVAMSMSCPHAKAVKRYIERKGVA